MHGRFAAMTGIKTIAIRQRGGEVTTRKITGMID
jgi:hypothetical protein